MANPIIPSGTRRFNSLYDSQIDIAEVARLQDTERRIREDTEHFERTGENRLPIYEYNPLVDDDRPDVASDGDSYDERGYVEDSPSQILDDSIIRNRNRLSNTETEIINDLWVMHGIDASNETSAYNHTENSRIPISSRIPRAQNITPEQRDYMGRERSVEEKKTQEKIEKTKNNSRMQ